VKSRPGWIFALAGLLLRAGFGSFSDRSDSYFAALSFAHRAFCAAAIFLRDDADIVRLAGAELLVFPADIACDSFRTFAHRALCASAILRREAAEIMRVRWRVVVCESPIRFKDSIPEITWSNFSISTCARLRFSRSS
jgi:hypothetical protein